MKYLRFLPAVCCLMLSCGSSSGTAPSGGAGGADSQTGSQSGGGATSGASAVGGSGGATATEAHIQDVRDGTIARNTEVTLKGVFITALNGSIAGTNLWVQEAQGVTTANHEYPQYAGMQAFADYLMGSVKVGDCVDLTGPVGLERSVPELGGVDELVQRDAASCGTPPEPLSIDTDEAFAGITLDTDSQTDGAQPGPDTAGLCGVLLALPSVTVSYFGTLATAGTEQDILVQRAGTGPEVLVFPPFTKAPFTATKGEIISVTGVLTNAIPGYAEFGVVPRTVADIVTTSP